MTELQGMYREHARHTTDCAGDSLAQQQFKEECDVNHIMKKYEKTGILEHRNNYEGRYGDFLSAPDYHSAMNAICAADEMFMSVPASIRQRFGNDPAAFLEFVQDPENLDEVRELGLAKAVPPTASLPVEAEPDRKSVV